VADWGFKIPSVENRYISKVNSVEGVMNFINHWSEERQNLPFEIDGIVIKVNAYHRQEELGYTAKSPRWAIAYKFKAERVESVLETVTYQVGRTGAITPVANLKAIQLGGTTVKRASLHNADQIEKLDLHINDAVFVEKGGEIIPKIVGVNLDKRKANAEKIIFLENCPECQTELIREEGDVRHYCPNENGCPTQIKGRIEHFIGRKTLDIDGLGAETVDLLVENKLIRDVADLYDLTFDQIYDLDRMAEKSANNLLKGLEGSKLIPFPKVLFGLGIRYVGETVAKKLAKALKNIDTLMKADFDTLIEIDEIGDRIATSILHYFSEEKHQLLIERLKAKGLQFEIEESEDASNILRENLSLCQVYLPHFLEMN